MIESIRKDFLCVPSVKCVLLLWVSVPPGGGRKANRKCTDWRKHRTRTIDRMLQDYPWERNLRPKSKN